MIVWWILLYHVFLSSFKCNIIRDQWRHLGEGPNASRIISKQVKWAELYKIIGIQNFRDLKSAPERGYCNFTEFFKCPDRFENSEKHRKLSYSKSGVDATSRTGNKESNAAYTVFVSNVHHFKYAELLYEVFYQYFNSEKGRLFNWNI